MKYAPNYDRIKKSKKKKPAKKMKYSY